MRFVEMKSLTSVEQRLIDLGFAEIKPNHLSLSEGKRNDEIVEQISHICILGQYPTHETNNKFWEVWYWNNPTCVHCTLTFNTELPIERINEIITQMEQICGETGNQTWINYRLVYNQQKLNMVAYNFINDMANQRVKYAGKDCHITFSGLYNDNCVASFVMPVRNRKNGYRLDNLETVKLALANGYLD